MLSVWSTVAVTFDAHKHLLSIYITTKKASSKPYNELNLVNVSVGIFMHPLTTFKT